MQSLNIFIKDFGNISASLTNLTRKGFGIQKYNIKCDEAFELLEAITSSPILISSDWKKSFRSHIDASETSVGGALTQIDLIG